MIRKLLAVSLMGMSAGCGLIPMPGSSPAAPPGPTSAELWDAAHRALQAEAFPEAERLFFRLAGLHPDRPEAREAIFFVGSLRLDPGNPGWDPAGAVDAFEMYLRGDIPPAREAEAGLLADLARQLVPPGGDRIRALLTTPVEPTDPAALQREVARLRALVAEREQTIQEQREEIERIRRTLVPTPPR